jgi:hypothetical protein
MKCSGCRRDMKSTRVVITTLIMMDVVKHFRLKLCRTCRKRHRDGVKRKG